MGYVSNNRYSFRISTGHFEIEQRNAGFTENDGKWMISHLPELQWVYGQLRVIREGAFLGAFDLEEDAVRAAAYAPAPPACDEVATMGRVSC